jgi:hypothetical protein
LFEKTRQPIVLVVVLVIVIENGRRIECEDDDDYEDESQTGLFKQALSLHFGFCPAPRIDGPFSAEIPLKPPRRKPITGWGRLSGVGAVDTRFRTKRSLADCGRTLGDFLRSAPRESVDKPTKQ